MSGLFGSLSIALSGLSVSQQEMATTSNNVANANTPGYTREVSDVAAGDPVQVGSRSIGTGVVLEKIESLRDPMLQIQINQATQENSSLNASLTQLQQIQTQFASSTSGIGADISNFFNSLQQLSPDPSDLTLRQGVLTAADTLATDFNTAAQNLQTQGNNVDQNVVQSVSQVNALTSQIASVDQQIGNLQSSNQTPGTLVDQQNNLIQQLSALINVQVIPTGNSITLATSNGTTLVSGSQSFALSTKLGAGADGAQVQHIMAGTEDITGALSGGSLAGLIQVRDQEIPSIGSSLDQLAAGLANGLNTANAAGYDLNGKAGGNLFVPPPVGGVGAAATLTVSVTDPALIAASSDGSTGSNGNLVNNNNNLTGAAGVNINQVITSGGNFADDTNLVPGGVFTVTRGSAIATYTAGNGGATMAQLLAAISTGTTQGTPITGNDVGVTVAEAGFHTNADTANLAATLVNGNLQITDGTNAGNMTAVETSGNNPNMVQGSGSFASLSAVLGAGDVFTATRNNGQTTTYTVGANGATVAELISAINTGASVGANQAAYDITVGGTDVHSGYTAALAGAGGTSGDLQVTDTTNAGDVSFVESGTPNLNVVTTTGLDLSGNGSDLLATGEQISLTRNGQTATYTAAAGATVADLETAIQTATSAGTYGTNGDITVAGVGGSVVAMGGYSATVTGGQFQVTDLSGAALTASDTGPLLGGGALSHTFQAPTGGTFATTANQQLVLADNTLIGTGLCAVADTPLANGQTPINSYSNLVAQVGSATANTSADADSSSLVLQQLQDENGSVSGVSLNEEAANLIQFQTAYQSAAKVVSTINLMLLDAVNLGMDVAEE